MKVNYIKVGLITVASIATVYGIYRLAKYVRDSRDEEDEYGGSMSGTSTTSSGTSSEKEVATKPSFDANKVVKKGSKGGEAGAIQIAFNNIIKDMKKAVTPTSVSTVDPLMTWSSGQSSSSPNISTYVDISVNPQKEARRKQIASIPLLVQDQDFGTKSANAMKIIMGADSTTYNKVKQKRIDLAKTYGLPNPY